MRRRSKAGDKPTKARRPEAAALKRRNRPKTRRRSSAIASLEAQVVRLTRELNEAFQQQTATADVLKVISRSTFDLQTVLDTLLESAARLCEARRGVMFRRDGDSYHGVAFYNTSPEIIDFVKRHPIKPGRHTITARVALERRTIHVADLQADPEYKYVRRDIDPIRTELGVPMFRGNDLVGVIILYKLVVQPFTDKQIELVTTFADQAVIAIENVRLFEAEQQRSRELAELLELQTATSEVLQVISRSTFDLPNVLNTLLELAARLSEADRGVILRRTGRDASYFVVASYRHAPEFNEYLRNQVFTPGRSGVTSRVLLEGKSVQIADVLADPEYTLHEIARLGDFRTILGVPLQREGTTIGVVLLQRAAMHPFSEKQIKLVETFADQAVIAIENTRLFEAEQQRTRELTDSLQQQTATADVLRVISRSAFNLQAVLNTLTESAVRLCAADLGLIFQQDGDVLRLVANFGVSREAERYWLEHPVPVGRGSTSGRALLEGRAIHIPDVLADPEYRAGRYQELAGYRSTLSVPLLRDGTTIGVFGLGRREPNNPFTDKQAELVTTFADQAVIAIENARLLNELRESLQRQTATADVLKVISRSTFDLRTVLQTLLESAARFCDADKASIIREKDGAFYAAEAYGYSEEFLDYMKNIPIKAERGSASGRALVEGRVVHITDVAADPEYTLIEGARLGDYRTILCVPMLREGVPIGLLVLTRSEVQPFTHEQIELVTTFADQAAIAIENVRLFEAEQQRTRELAKSLENLRTTQDRLVQTQKLASLGQLTAGIAHEIKNPLNFVNNFSGVSAELIDELREALDRMKVMPRRALK